jgi:hypothetical protein
MEQLPEEDCFETNSIWQSLRELELFCFSSAWMKVMEAIKY